MANVMKAPQPPPTFKYTIENIIKDGKEFANTSSSDLANILEKVTKPGEATFDNFVKPIALGQSKIRSKYGPLLFLWRASPDQTIRDAAREAVDAQAGYESKFAWNGDVYERVKKVREDYQAKKNLDDECVMLVEDMWQGLVKRPDGKDFNRKEFQKLSDKFDEARKKYFKAPNEATGDNVPSNLTLFAAMRNIWHEQALFLGEGSRANLVLKPMMAKKPANVEDLLNDIKRRIPKIKAPQVKETSAEKLDLAGYFPLGHTVSATLKLFGELFGLTFEEVKTAEDRARVGLPSTVKAEDVVWAKGVQLFAVWDDGKVGSKTQDGTDFVGYLYLDLVERPAKSYAETCTVQPGWKEAGGKRHYPVTAIVGSMVEGKDLHFPDHRHLADFFHEMGHAMHDLLTQSRFYCLSGLDAPKDFNEAISQMMEQWCWIPEVLRRISKPPMSDKLVDALVQSRKTTPDSVLKELQVNLFDLKIHSEGSGPRRFGSNDEAAKYYGKIYNDIWKDVTGEDTPKPNWIYTRFRSFSTGYGAKSYSYLWSNVYAVDMFASAFARDPLNGETGRRYRREVLEKGHTQDPMKTLTTFLGRAPSRDAYFKQLDSLVLKK